MKLKWLPIESAPNVESGPSAPKDETAIILGDKNFPKDILVSFFSERFSAWVWDVYKIKNKLWKPTHWLPIPEFEEEEESEYCEWYRETGCIRNTTSCNNEIYMEFFDFIKNPDRKQKIFKYCPMCSKEIKWASSSSG